MIEKVNIRVILEDHIKTFRNANNGNMNYVDISLFFVFSLIPVMALTYFKVSLDANLVNFFITSFSIFAALLFNLLLITYDIMQKTEKSHNMYNIKINLLKDICSNISFCILVSIFVIFLLIVSYILKMEKMEYSHILFSGIIYYLVAIFLLTIVMILKRIHILLIEEFKSKIAH